MVKDEDVYMLSPNILTKKERRYLTHIVNLNNNKMYKIDGAASLLFNCINGKSNTRRLLSSVSKKAQLPSKFVEKKARALINKLVQLKIIEKK